MAVGLNPGTSTARERAFYVDSEISYDRVKKYRILIAGIRYLVRARSIIDQLGLSGPILLWPLAYLNHGLLWRQASELDAEEGRPLGGGEER